MRIVHLHVLARELGIMSSIKPVGKKRASSLGGGAGTKRSRLSAAAAMESSSEEEMDDGDTQMSQVASQQLQEAEQKGEVRNPQVSVVLSVCNSVCICVSSVAVQREADVGVIDRIQLTDFMCHRKLDVQLSPNVNFILGRNGSK